MPRSSTPHATSPPPPLSEFSPSSLVIYLSVSPLRRTRITLLLFVALPFFRKVIYTENVNGDKIPIECRESGSHLGIACLLGLAQAQVSRSPALTLTPLCSYASSGHYIDNSYPPRYIRVFVNGARESFCPSPTDPFCDILEPSPHWVHVGHSADA